MIVSLNRCLLREDSTQGEPLNDFSSIVHFKADCILYFSSSPKGGLVKIALGGALFSMGQHVTSPQDALHFAEQMQVGL